jgi:hypothetical protein
MLTYKEIQSRYKRQFGTTIKTCWIADVKRHLGLTTRIAYNRITQNTVLYPCPNDTIKKRITELLKNEH